MTKIFGPWYFIWWLTRFSKKRITLVGGEAWRIEKKKKKKKSTKSQRFCRILQRDISIVVEVCQWWSCEHRHSLLELRKILAWSCCFPLVRYFVHLEFSIGGYTTMWRLLSLNLSFIVVVGATASLRNSTTSFFGQNRTEEASQPWDRVQRWLQQSSNTKIRGISHYDYIISFPL